MSRKSKTTILKEKLALISDCPTDIFDKLDNEDLLGMIQDAENGNAETIAELSVLLFKTYGNARSVNRSLGYILEKGVGLSVPRSAEILITHASKNSECLDYVTRAIDLIDYCDINIDESDRLNAKFKSIIRSAENMRSLEAKKKDLEGFDRDRRIYGELYLTYKALVQTGTYDVEYTRSILAEASLPPILDLPSFSDGKKTAPEKIKDGWCESLIRALHICSLDVWQDFWLRCIYEYCIVYLNSDFTAFAEDIAIALNNRRFSQKARLHALAFIEYLCDNTPHGSEKHDQLAEWYRRVSEECVLD